MLAAKIKQVEGAALALIEAAADMEALESVRVDAPGRKGSLAQFSNHRNARDLAILKGHQALVEVLEEYGAE